MRAPNTVHKWLLSLILLIGCLSVSAKEKEYILFLSSVNAEEAWIHGFRNELQKRFPYEGNIELHVNPEKPDVPLNKNDAFQKVQKRRVQEKR